MDQDYLSIPEVARRLKYHSQTIRDQVRSGAIPSIKIGNHYRIPVSWLQEQESKVSGKKAEPAKEEKPASGSTAVVQTPTRSAPESPTEVKTFRKFQPKPSKVVAAKKTDDWTPPLFAGGEEDDD